VCAARLNVATGRWRGGGGGMHAPAPPVGERLRRTGGWVRVGGGVGGQLERRPPRAPLGGCGGGAVGQVGVERPAFPAAIGSSGGRWRWPPSVQASAAHVALAADAVAARRCAA